MEFTGVKAIGRTGDSTDFAIIKLEDVYYIELQKPSKYAKAVPLLHTNNGPYYQINTLEGFKVILEQHHFYALDSVNVVNLDQIEYIEQTPYYIHACFKDGSYTSVAESNLYKVEHIPRKKTGK